MWDKKKKKMNKQAKNKLINTDSRMVGTGGEKGQKEHGERKGDRIHGDGEWLDSGW